MKHKVLVSAIGTVTAASIVHELKKNGNYYILGADINNQYEIATSLDVDEYYKFPLALNDEYLSFIIDFCRDHQVDYYFAVIDKEVVKLAENREKFTEIGTNLCVVNREFAEICHYKDVFNNWISENIPFIGIKSYKNYTDAERASFPLFIKPVEGVGSAGCVKINNSAELKSLVYPDDFGKKILVQEFITGQNITVDCVRNRKTGQKIQIQRRELLRNSHGCGIAVEIIHDDKLSEICDELMEKLDLNGVCNMEFFETDSGYKIIEINPRFSAGTTYSCMAGVNTVQAAIDIADGRECTFGEIAVGAHFAERYEAYRMD